jgi:non-ribosomal peptide synthetase component F
MTETFVEGFRLSRQQRHLWRLQQHDQISAYRVLCAVRIEGQLDEPLFRATIASVFKRHEILRTRFQDLPEMNTPLQVIAADIVLAIDEYDFSKLTQANQEAKIERLFRQLSKERVHPESTPDGRAALVTQSDLRHVLILSLPALQSDARSLANLIAEVQQTYAAALRGEESSDEVCQYLQFSEWQNDLRNDTDYQAGSQFWNQHLAACETAATLPFEQPPTSDDAFEPEVWTTEIGPQSRPRTESTAANYSVSDSTFLLACWQVLLWRLTAQAEIVVSNLCEYRDFEELQRAIGPFAEGLPVCASLHPNVQFSELLKQTEVAVSNGIEWREYFDWPQNGESTNGGPPFVPFCFEFREAATTQSDDLSFSIFKYYTCADRFKIKLCFLRRADDSLAAAIHYDSKLFQARDIQRLALRLNTLIESAGKNPGATIAELELLSDLEREQILIDFNNTARPYPTDKLVFHLFEDQAEQNPESIAVVFEKEQLTFRALNERANQLARYLRIQGVGPEIRVGLCLPRSLETIIGLLGVLKAGGVYVPLEPSLPKDRLQDLLDNANCSVVVTQQSLAASVTRISVPLLCVDADWEAVSQQSTANLSIAVLGTNAAYVIYTSGSTGKPKGVVVEHGQLLAYVQAIVERLDLSAQTGFAMVSTFAADLGHTATFPSLCIGACLHVISEARITDAQLLGQYFSQHQIDCLKIVPSHLSVLLDTALKGQVLPRQRLVLGGEPAHRKLIERIHALAP